MALRSRRPNPPRERNYQRYKRLLREDFIYACAYCSLHENESGGPRFFTVEHFQPKSLFPALTTEYSNLLYACGVCNSYKGNDWPGGDPLETGQGYLDPCVHDYDQHFVLNGGFELEAQTPVAAYMIERLHLNRTMLVKIRRSRLEEDQAHRQFMELYERNLELLAGALAARRLSRKKRRKLEQELAVARSQYERYLENWRRRGEPLYSMDDY